MVDRFLTESFRMSPRAAAPLLVALLAVLPGAGSKPARDAGARPLVLLHSSDEQSEIAPCDCEGGDTGGLPRRAAEFAIVEAAEDAVFKCSSGDIFASPTEKATARLRELKIHAMKTALSRMHYDALAAGETDLAFGADFLRRLRDEDGLPFLCANAYDADGQRILDPYVVVERGGVRVAFVAVVSDRGEVLGLREMEIRRHRIALRDPVAEVQPLLPALREQADVIVLLAHAGPDGALQLARALDVDVVLPGHRPPIQAPRRDGKLLVASAGEKSDHYGVLRLTLDAQGTITAFSGEPVEVRREGPQDDELAGLAAEVEVLEFPNAVPDGEYAGAESCRECHEDVWERWSRTKHAHAFETLAATDDWDNAQCIGCHTTGAKDKFYLDPDAMHPAQLNVQCEECHGPGAEHVATQGTLKANPKRCTVCHDPKNSPAFEWTSYLERGVH